MLTPPMPHACFLYFSDTCNLGSNGSTKFLESMLFFIPFWRAGPTLVLEYYGNEILVNCWIQRFRIMNIRVALMPCNCMKAYVNIRIF
jgi:hypothetical protein